MNKQQKTLTGMAVALFLATLVFAPWEIVYPAKAATTRWDTVTWEAPHGEIPVRHFYRFGPIWDGPKIYGGGAPELNLRYGVIGIWWLALAGAYAAGFITLKK